jgi:hypothetical protein
MKCPLCGTTLPAKPTNEWNYRKNYYHVKSYKCPKCHKVLMMYYHENKLSHTIPKKKSYY